MAAGSQSVEIRLIANGQIRGRVRPPASADLAGLEVRGVGESNTERSARLGAEGRFVLENLPPGTYRILARAGGLVAAAGPGVAVRAGEIVRDLVVDLVPGGVIEGRVTTATGEPVAGADIEAGAGSGVSPPTGVTDVAGHFRLEGLLPGTWRLYVYGGGILEVLQPVVVVEAGRTHRLELTARR